MDGNNNRSGITDANNKSFTGSRSKKIEKDYDGSSSKGNPEFSKYVAVTMMDWVRLIEKEATRLGLLMEDESPEIRRQLTAMLLAMEVVTDFRKGKR